MTQHFILTITGQDRPGLVERVASVVAAHRGNWLESRLIHLGGCFAGVVRVEVASAAAPGLRGDLAALSAGGLSVTALPVHAGERSGEVAVKLEVTGLDHPGIVSQISAAVARAGLNVEEFTSEVTSAPMSGEPLFTAVMQLTGPAGADLAALSDALERLSEELLVDISVEPQA